MASATANEIEINNIKAELALSVKLSNLSGTQRREVIEKIFPNGVAFDAEDPQIKTGDECYGEGFDSVNSGKWWFGKALVDGPFIKSGAGAAVEDVDIQVKIG